MGIKDSLAQLHDQRLNSGYYERLNQGPTTAEALLATGIEVAGTAVNIFAQAKQAEGDDGSDKTQSSSVASLQAENKKIFYKYEVSDLQGLKQKYDAEVSKYKSAESKLNDANTKLKTTQDDYNSANKKYSDACTKVANLQANLDTCKRMLESPTLDDNAKAKVQNEINAINKEIEEEKLEEKKAELEKANNELNGENGAVKAQQTAETEFNAIKETFIPLSNDYKQAAANQKQIDSLSGHVSEDKENISNVMTLVKNFDTLYNDPKPDNQKLKQAADELIKFIDDNPNNPTVQKVKTTDTYKNAQKIANGEMNGVSGSIPPENLRVGLDFGFLTKK